MPTFCWRSPNKGSFNTDLYGCIFHSFSAWYIFLLLFSFRNSRRPPVGRELHFDETNTYSLCVSIRLQIVAWLHSSGPDIYSSV
jgi:hypothetical protein